MKNLNLLHSENIQWIMFKLIMRALFVLIYATNERNFNITQLEKDYETLLKSIDG